MYYRRSYAPYNSSEAQKKIESFNKELLDQYRQRRNVAETTETKYNEHQNITADATRTSLTNLLTADNIIIMGLIILLILEENKDYVLIGILASIMFLNS